MAHEISVSISLVNKQKTQKGTTRLPIFHMLFLKEIEHTFFFQIHLWKYLAFKLHIFQKFEKNIYILIIR